MAQVSVNVPRDLIEASEAPLDELRVPAGWEPIATICRRVYLGLEELTKATVDRIQAEIPAYGKSEVPRSDVEKSVFRNIEMMLAGIAEHRGPLPEELGIRAWLARPAALGGP